MHRIDEPHPFALETATLQYAKDRPVAAKHLRLELDLDFETQSISGFATHTLEAVGPVSVVSFDAVELAIEQVTVDGKVANFDAASGQQVHVHLNRPLKPGQQAKVELRYHATPRRGLYFVGPDKAYPKRPRQAWTQGQDIDSRWYFPCLDTPAQKCSSEVVATFPSGLMALSNGTLVEDVTRSGRRRMHYRLDGPHSPYLVTLVVGAFEVYDDRAGSTTVRTLFPKGRKADALRCVKRTPQMVKLFERLTGRAYPWGDYSQVFVSEFIFGGMENTGATTLTDSVLHDERAALDYSAESLISHELAHQWFGDLLTCRDWPHGWLNEGFATYAEILWREEADGLDEADHQRQLDLDAYLAEVSERYARPIVARKFDAPIDLFDHHLYEKGGLVLHELRTRLGDAPFFAVLAHYVQAHAGKTVETVDLARSIETVTGKNFDRFFDEYVLRPGHPQLKVEARYDAEQGLLRVAVKQTQEGAVYALTLPLEVVVGKQQLVHALELTEKEHTFLFDVAREPAQVIFDGRRALLATLEVDKPAGWWREELLHAKWSRAQASAAAALGKDGSAQSIDALARALRNEQCFHATRAACAKALAAIRSPSAKGALLSALTVKHPKARRAVVAALGAFRDDADVLAALTKVCKQGDASIFVEAEAARSLGKLRHPSAFPVLQKLLARPSFSDTVRSGAIDGLVELQDPKAWPLIVAAAAYGQPQFARRTAASAMAKLAEVAGKKTKAVDRLGQLLRDPNFRVRLAAIDAAGSLGDARLVGPLTSTPFLDGREARLAREAVRTLRSPSTHKELAALRGDFELLKGEVRSLKEKLDAKGTSKKHQA